MHSPPADFEEYIAAAEELVRDYYVSRDIVLATDDHNLVVELLANPSTRRNFTYYFANYDRRIDTDSAVDFARKHGTHLQGVIKTVTDLILCSHPNIGGFVVTTGSNFGRLINELRKTDGKRRDYPFADLTPGEC